MGGDTPKQDWQMPPPSAVPDTWPMSPNRIPDGAVPVEGSDTLPYTAPLP
jgi:hypothetical protein